MVMIYAGFGLLLAIIFFFYFYKKQAKQIRCTCGYRGLNYDSQDNIVLCPHCMKVYTIDEMLKMALRDDYDEMVM